MIRLRVVRGHVLPLTCPHAVDVKGVEFIEFAASDDEANALGGMLTALGFAPVAQPSQQGGDALDTKRHQSGRQQRARGFCQQFRRRARRIGLRDGPAGGRCPRRPWHVLKALGIARFEQAVGPDEMEIPGVRGVGGSLIYFIEDGSEDASLGA